MKIAIGCDPNAMKQKDMLVKVVQKLGHEVVDFGSEDPIYANTAIQVGEYVAAGKADRGILLCGTGLGMSIAANKVKGVIAALISDTYSCERSIKSNNANVACFGAFVMGDKLIEMLATQWLGYKFDASSPSAAKVARYVSYDMERK